MKFPCPQYHTHPTALRQTHCIIIDLKTIEQNNKKEVSPNNLLTLNKTKKLLEVIPQEREKEKK